MYCSSGIRKTVSTSLYSRRFMSAIWNSYSMSETARRPRMRMRDFLALR